MGLATVACFSNAPNDEARYDATANGLSRNMAPSSRKKHDNWNHNNTLQWASSGRIHRTTYPPGPGDTVVCISKAFPLLSIPRDARRSSFFALLQSTSLDRRTRLIETRMNSLQPMSIEYIIYAIHLELRHNPRDLIGSAPPVPLESNLAYPSSWEALSSQRSAVSFGGPRVVASIQFD